MVPCFVLQSISDQNPVANCQFLVDHDTVMAPFLTTYLPTFILLVSRQNYFKHDVFSLPFEFIDCSFFFMIVLYFLHFFAILAQYSTVCFYFAL